MPDELERYLAAVDEWGVELPVGRLDAGPTPRPAGRSLRHLPARLLGRNRWLDLRFRLLFLATRAVAPIERRRARGLARRRPLRLHLGCGPNQLDGWVDVDVVGHPVDLRWDLTQPLPLASGSVDAVFHEHVLEHLPLAAGLAFLRDNHRVLRPGGVLRVVVPDAGAYVDSCARDGAGMLSRVRTDRPTRMLALNELFYGATHVAMYDEATLRLFLRSAGFTTIDVCSFGESRLDPVPDHAGRRDESLYLEAVR